MLFRSGAERLGLSCIKAEVNNAKVFSEDMPIADKVLCDAPCSGLGVIRRKPEIKYKNPADFDRLPDIQYDILKTSAEYVKIGGTLVYSTCTLSRAENDEVAERFLRENPGFAPSELGEAFGESRSIPPRSSRVRKKASLLDGGWPVTRERNQNSPVPLGS